MEVCLSCPIVSPDEEDSFVQPEDCDCVPLSQSRSSLGVMLTRELNSLSVFFLVNFFFLGGMDSWNEEGGVLDDGFLVFDHFGDIFLPSLIW